MTLTALQRKFAENIAHGMGKREAAIEAGYSKKSAHVQATRNLNNDKVQECIVKLQEQQTKLVQQRFVGMAEDAIQELFNVLMDIDTPPQTKTNTAKILLDYAGFKPIEKQEVSHEGEMNINNPYADLTTEELRKLADANDG